MMMSMDGHANREGPLPNASEEQQSALSALNNYVRQHIRKAAIGVSRHQLQGVALEVQIYQLLTHWNRVSMHCTCTVAMRCQCNITRWVPI
jgi:hypothetical protein